MYLKSLQIQGFKSFPDKTEVTFSGGFTAIVGPNGSGKSNISDAIRWVLGEQSTKSLRGAKMEDVIFGGTQKRGPVGFAEVSLILDNSTGVFRSEYSEIMVTRRYYRSGESEYYINKKHVRLRDINEMFMDTGLGRDGYSIIGQGRVDEILSTKSEDRREVFEEAAGITKFRYRKQEAERKLKATEENLVRIRDIWSELEAQASPLEKQSEKAKKYLVLRDELRVLEISLWLLGLEQVTVDAKENEEKLSIAKAQLDKIVIERDEFYKKSEQISEKICQVDIETERLRTELSEYEHSASERASRCAVIKTNIKNARDNAERLNEEINNRSTNSDDLLNQIKFRQERTQEIDRKLDELYKILEQNETESTQIFNSTAKIKEQIEEKTAYINKIEHEINLYSSTLSGEKSRFNSIDERKNTIDIDINSAKERLDCEKDKRKELSKAFSECEDNLVGHQNMFRGLALKKDSRQKKVEEAFKLTNSTESALTDCKNKIRMLTNMQKDYEGFSKSIKVIMRRAEIGAITGIYGPVSSLISVEKDYVQAIETALGAASTNIVVDNQQNGKKAINYLKSVDAGRATFLPIDTIKPFRLNEKGLEKENGFIGIGAELVDCDEKYTNIVSSLLGRTVIVDTLDNAIVISKKFNTRFKVVTLDGQVINSGGSMTGGSASRSSGILSRANQLDEEIKNEQKLQKNLDNAQDSYKKAKTEFASLDFELKAIETQQRQASEEKARLGATLSQHEALLDSLQAHYDQLVLEKNNIEEAKESLKNKILQIEDKLQKSQESHVEIKLSIDKMNLELSDQNREGALVSENTAKVQMDISQLNAQNQELLSSLDDLNKVKVDMFSGIDQARQRAKEYINDVERLELEFLETEKLGESTKTNCEKIKALITASIGNRMRIEGERSTIDKTAQKCSDDILSLEREKVRLENKALQIRNEESQILDKMWEKYEITPIAAKEVSKPIENLSETKTRVSSLKNSIRSLGNVNVDAIEEYIKLSERLNFITDQKDDLEKSQKELYKVIDKLTENMKNIFAEQFAILNKHFSETFIEIFGGGHAELALEDKYDILNCGIEIKVTPPGKSLKTLTLLSGGEKAFVAIALYFAILKVRPTPFCILDEIEAALDDVNVVRFAKYINKLSDKTQFIVITHRRGTMEEADMLYGVTMQEQGVSKLLMLNMAEAEKQLGIKLK